MDGLTIGNTQGILDTGLTSKEINRVNPQEVSPSFVTSLQNAVNSVNAAQKDSDHKMQELATGKSQNIHETMIAAEKADIALRLMVQVRNKMIEAYQEMMRMQV